MLQPDSSCLYRQLIQTEWSLLPEVFAQICRRWHRPSVDLFATRFKQGSVGRGYEIRLTLCPPLETDALVQSKADCPEGQAYSGSPERHSRQAVPTQSAMIQTEWSLLPEVFAQICRRWHRPSVDLFATRFNHKLPRFVSPVPDQSAWEVDALSLPWEDLDAYGFPPTALLHQVVTKLLDHGFRRLILIAPGWPNMPWFWDLVNMSAQIPLLLPQVSNLITQPFNQCPHRDLPNLNLHAWLLEPLPSSKPGSRQKWQQELRLLKDALPEPFMTQSGPFLSDGVRKIRWTSELPL